jgi:TetR/AcrR family transcriptional regulator, regulator of biofilm formation and stress response
MNRMNVDDRRAKLVDAAIEVMARDGVSHATTRAIVTEAGMTTGAFHYCFFSKEELVLEVMRSLHERAFEIVSSELDATAGGVDVIDRVVGAYVDHVASDAARRQLVFELNLHALRESGLRDAAVKHHRAKLDGAEGLLQRMADAAGFRWRHPTEELARLTMGVVDGVSYQWLVTGEEFVPQRLHEAVALFLRTQVEPAGPVGVEPAGPAGG